jgi:hypothetical protein
MPTPPPTIFLCKKKNKRNKTKQKIKSRSPAVGCHERETFLKVDPVISIHPAASSQPGSVYVMYMYVRTCYYCSTSRLVDSLCDVLLSRHNEKSLPFIIAQKRKRNKRKNLWTTSIVVVEGRRRLKRTSVCSSFFISLRRPKISHINRDMLFFLYS